MLLLAAACLAGAATTRTQQTVVLRPSFENLASAHAWTFDGTGEWTFQPGLMILSKAGTPAGAIRRPAALAILNSPPFTRVSMTVDIRSTAPIETPERDLEVVFGYRSPARFYYVHLAGVTNDVHNGIFLVNDADRKRIDPGTTPPQLSDQAWHHVRLERDGATGVVDVFVDAAQKPTFHATDTTLSAGQVGLGSFDDTGEFRNVVVTGTRE